MLLEIKAKHIIGTNFDNNCECAIAKALRDVLPGGGHEFVSEGVDSVAIGRGAHRRDYGHEYYGGDDFEVDQHLASTTDNPEAVIRRIEIYGLNPADHAR